MPSRKWCPGKTARLPYGKRAAKGLPAPVSQSRTDVYPKRNAAPLASQPMDRPMSGEGRGARGGGRDGHVTNRGRAHQRARGPVEIEGGDQGRAPELMKVVADPFCLKGPSHNVFQRSQGEEPRRHVPAAPGQDIGPV